VFVFICCFVDKVANTDIVYSFVATDMGNAGAKKLGLEAYLISLEESVNGMMAVIDSAARENSSGKFIGFDGSPRPW
jgi:norsolorinic acid ketoreductase